MALGKSGVVMKSDKELTKKARIKNAFDNASKRIPARVYFAIRTAINKMIDEEELVSLLLKTVHRCHYEK